MRQARALVLAVSVASLAGCGGGGSSTDKATYDVQQARSCFENAALQTTLKRSGDVRRLRVYSEGLAGPPYVTLGFTPRHRDAVRLAKGSEQVRGNVVISGPGIGDDSVTQCLLEAKR